MPARLSAGRGAVIAILAAIGLTAQMAQPIGVFAATSTPARSASPSPTARPTSPPPPTETPAPKPVSASPSRPKPASGAPKPASAPTVSAGGSTTYSAAVLADSPAAYYRLGETSGTTAADSSGHGNNATINGTVTLNSPGALPSDTDGSMLFTNGFVQTPYVMTSVSSYTEEAWIKTTDTTTLGGHLLGPGR